MKEETKINEISGMSILEENQTKPLAIVKERISPEFYQEISLNAFAKHLDLSPIGKYWELSRLIFGGKKDSYFRFVSSDHCHTNAFSARVLYFFLEQWELRLLLWVISMQKIY